MKLHRRILSIMFCFSLNLFNINSVKSESLDISNYDIYISTNGNDNNNGTKNAPYATLYAAQEKARQLITDMDKDILIFIDQGTYYLDKTIVMNEQDSGKNGYKVIWSGVKGKTIISGGREITNWKLHDADKNIYVADSNRIDTRQLFINNQRLQRARSQAYPIKPIMILTDYGYESINGYNPIKNYKNVSDIEFVYNNEWSQSRLGINSIDQNGNILMDYTGWTSGRNIHSQLSVGYPDWIENAYELLDENGEWYLDLKTQKCYIIPPKNVDLNKDHVVAPILEQIISSTNPDSPVKNVIFKNIVFKHGTWMEINNEAGYPVLQATFTKYGDRPVGFIRLVNSENITFLSCGFTQVGTHALDFGSGTSGLTVNGCHFYDLSGSAIMLGGIDDKDAHPNNDERFITENNTITNNYIHNIGAEYSTACGIWIGYSRQTTVSNNEIFDVPYTAISGGWGWGSVDLDQDNPSICKDNTYTHNLIYDHMKMLKDGGGIYLLGAQPNTLISENVIYNQHNRYAALYLDDGSKGETVTKNVTYKNILDLLVKGKDHTIKDNYSDKFTYQFDAGAKKEDMSYFGDNIITEDFPQDIIDNCGVSKDYESVKSIIDNAVNKLPDFPQKNKLPYSNNKEIIVNGSFEDNIYDNFMGYCAGVKGYTTEIATGIAHTGNRSIKVNNKADWWANFTYAGVKFEQGVTYTLSMWVKVPNPQDHPHKVQATFVLPLEHSPYNKAFYTSSYATQAIENSDWVHLEKTFTTRGPTSDMYNLYISSQMGTTNASTAEFYIDDISLIKHNVLVLDVTLDKTILDINVGESEILKYDIFPDNATNKAVKWESDNQNVATVDQNGKVTAISKGSATITVVTEDGELTASCLVKVNGKDDNSNHSKGNDSNNNTETGERENYLIGLFSGIISIMSILIFRRKKREY